MKKNIFVFVPTDKQGKVNYRLCEWLGNLQSNYNEDYNFTIKISSKYPIPFNYNTMLKQIYEQGFIYDYILIVEQDIVPNNMAFDLMLQQIEKYKVVSAIYYQVSNIAGINRIYPMILERKEDGGYFLYEKNPLDTLEEVILADHTGMGFLLLTKEILLLMRSKLFKFKEKYNKYNQVDRSQDAVLADFFYRNEIKICIPRNAEVGHIKEYIY